MNTPIEETVEQVPLKAIAVASNVRSDMDAKKLDELVQSIAQGGIRQPLIVRPQRAAGQVVPKKFELVTGHRRFAAAGKLELASVPCIVREIADADFKLEQLVENVQREDLQPLDRAAGFAELKAMGFDAQQIAAKVGMARSTVELGLHLNDLIPAGKKALRDGQLPLGAANELALVPVELQGKALKELLDDRRHDGEITVTRARELLRSEFRLELGDAPFGLKDAELVPEAGACAMCPKRTGAQPELFGEKKPDICTDVGCYRRKEGAWLKLQEKAGRKVMSSSQVASEFETYGLEPHLKYNSEYVLADEKNYTSGKTRRQELGKEGAEKIVLARSPQGPVVELVKRSDLPTAKAEKAPKHQKSAAEKRQAEQARVRRLVAERALTAIATAADNKEVTRADFVELLVDELLDSVGNDRRKLLASFLEEHAALKVGSGWDAATKALKKHLDTCRGDAHKLTGFGLQLIGAGALGTYGSLDALKPGCKLLDVDLVDLQKTVELERREKKKEKGGAKAAKKKTSKRESGPIIRWASTPNGKLPRIGKGLSGLTYRIERNTAHIGGKFSVSTQMAGQLKAGGSSVYGSFGPVNNYENDAPLVSLSDALELADAIEERELKQQAKGGGQ